MENYLYFAESAVEARNEALCVPASSYIGAEPGSGSTTLRFKNAMGDNDGVHTVVLSHAVGKNKEVMRGVMACINAHPSEGGFVVVANNNSEAVTAGPEYNKVFNGLGITTVAISFVETGGITGNLPGASSIAYGDGIVSTKSAPQYNRTRIGGDIVTTVLLDLTGLASKNDDGDVIGLDGGGAAYFFRYRDSETGIIHRIEMSCLEQPTASSNVGLDIDLFSSSNGGRSYDFDISSATQVIAGGTDMVLGDTLVNLADHGAANDYYYLVTGATHTGDCTYTAGQLMIKFYGHPMMG